MDRKGDLPSVNWNSFQHVYDDVPDSYLSDPTKWNLNDIKGGFLTNYKDKFDVFYENNVNPEPATVK